ncbi:hypothetical protein [Nocardioides cavernaquae]|uniref:PBP domain-containing protein n=1 Tax=Nocardioides cavernaquae TaxID=2321396 RepID=A0A3A5HDV7_9ACTN|nr:hypothetical protein [Nocardioides cavernaquae]RJS46190.1 hypothetical protein D4739_08205 [Nocardioides cavernaquae]
MNRTRATRVAGRAGAGLLALVACAAMFPATAGTVVPGEKVALAPRTAVGDGVDSSETMRGTGRFEDLKVTVSQTEHLRDQVVKVSWTGAAPSRAGASYDANYLQIMQCWGDGDAPDREKCQFGAYIGQGLGGGQTASRIIENTGNDLIDQDEQIKPGYGEYRTIPFQSVTGKTETSPRSSFFNTGTTNEIPYGRTSADGAGTEYFEIQTARESHGLGCGAVVTTGPRKCWLVVVPRDHLEVDGRTFAEVGGQLLTSPLITSNFRNALSFRLEFEPVGLACPIGASERHLIGHEDVVEAVSRWQPALCADEGLLFSYTQQGDDLARGQVLSDEPWLSVFTRPVEAASITDDREVVHSPLAVSGIGIAYVIERSPRSGSGYTAPPDVLARVGTRVLDLKLNARLVAKLLTQSYRAAVAGPGEYVADNPFTLAKDPEFVSLNPEFEHLDYFGSLPSVITPFENADANHAVWGWIASDKDAAAFVAGTPDKWGMKVNRYYRGMVLDQTEFPKYDPTCQVFVTTQAPKCTTQVAPYANDLHTAARATARGQDLTEIWDDASQRYRPAAAQPAGRRAALAIVDTGTAARYQLPMARLRNAHGKYVAPTELTMTSALMAMKDTEVDGVVEMDPTSEVASAYPLTSISYAATAPGEIRSADAKAYAEFLRFATGPGQVQGEAPGQLPEGYVPLTPALRAQALMAATKIEKGGTAQPDGDGDGGGDGEDPDGSGDGENNPVSPADGALGPGVPGGDVVQAAGPDPATQAGQFAGQQLASAQTPATHVGPVRWLLPIILALMLVAGIARPLVPWWLTRRKAG